MKISKPKFWDQKIGLYSLILYPFAILIKLIIFFKKRLIKSKTFNIPVICIGNIYLGGTGKTPTAILIANELFKIGKKPSIIRKYYSDHEDEYELIKKYYNNLLVNIKRSKAILEAENKSYDSVILDDGFQDYEIKKNLNIICFSQNQLVGNGMVIPSGPLRESLDVLKDVQVAIINGGKSKKFEDKILQYNKNLNIFYSKYYPIKSEILNIIEFAKEKNLQIIMTEKDYFKIKKFKCSEIGYLKIEIKIENCEKLIKLISSIYD